jgi:ABC-type glycerol-3-phosphate transport system substrate-binding protein
MQPKSRFRVSLFLTFLLSSGGCSSAPSVGPPPETITLRVACPPGAAADVVRSQSKAWQSRNNAVVEVVEAAGDKKDVEADILIIPPAELADWAAAGLLLPVPEDILENDDVFGWKGLEPLYREHLLLWDRTAYALPVLGEAPVLCYRSDLFKDADFVKAFNKELGREPADGRQPPATLNTWKEVEIAAKYFAAHPPAGMTASLPPLPDDDDGLEHEFYTIAAGNAVTAYADILKAPTLKAYSFQYDLETGKPRIASRGFVESLAMLQRLQAYRAAPGVSPVEAFRKGTGVFCLTDAAYVYRLQERDSAVRDKFAVARVPGGEGAGGGNWVPYLGDGSRLGVVLKSSAHPEEAFSLLAELGGRSVSRQVVLSPRSSPARGGDAFRADHFDRNARWEVFDLDPPRTEAFKKVVQQTVEHTGVANPVYRLRTPDQDKRRLVLLGELRAALKDPKSDPEAALKRVASRWEEMDRANPKYLNEYRLGIGRRAE